MYKCATACLPLLAPCLSPVLTNCRNFYVPTTGAYTDSNIGKRIWLLPWNWLTCCTGYGLRCCCRCCRGKCDCCCNCWKWMRERKQKRKRLLISELRKGQVAKVLQQDCRFLSSKLFCRDKQSHLKNPPESTGATHNAGSSWFKEE